MTDHVVADLLRSRDRVPRLRYSTFGHSFGALVSLSVAAAVARAVGQAPLRAILSAALPPRLQPPGDEKISLTDEELLDKMVQDGGTSPDLLSHRAMAEYLVRLMREDYAIRRQFSQDSSLIVDFPLTLVASRKDVYVSPDQMWKWSEHSNALCSRAEIPGGHFAVFHKPKEIIALAREDMALCENVTFGGSSRPTVAGCD